MSEEHLKQLRNFLKKKHWKIVAEKPGGGYRISAIWEVARPDGSSPLSIMFEGLDDLRTLPIEESYGCHIKELPQLGLYFARITRSWKHELDTFQTS